MKKLLILLFAGLVSFPMFATGGQDSEARDEVYGLSALMYNKYELGVTQQLENPDNVVSPYIQEKFGLKIDEFQKTSGDMTVPQAIAMWKGAGMVPDVMQVGAEDFGAMLSSGMFAPLDEYMEDMPNYQKFLEKRYWERETGEDGKVYAFYNLEGSPWPKVEPGRNDVVSNGINHRALWVREDVLEAIGYEYTPVMELKKETADKGFRPTFQEMAINPPVETPEDFLEFLRKIKAADLKAMDGSDMIPFSMVWWETWHLGIMYDWGYWRINKEGDVNGYLGLPGTKDYMKWLWTAYSEGLIDPDYLVHKSVQLQEKVATGKIASGEYVPDALGTFAQLENNVPGAIRHFIPFPKTSPDFGFYDPYNPHPYTRVLINKELPEEVKRKIAKFVDWTYSDEGAEILAWGPESAGLYEMVEGVKKFKDSAVEKAVLAGAVDGEGIYKWGLHDSVIGNPTDPLAAVLGPVKLHRTVFHEYNETSNYMGLISSVVASNPKFLGVSTKLQVANSDQSEVVQKVADWYWGIFSQTYLPQVLTAENEEQFEERYEQMIDAFMRETEYEKARENMVKYFDQYPPMF